MFGELVYLPVLWFTYQSVKNLHNLKMLSLVIWLWGVYLFFSFAATKMQAYTIIAAPALFIITAHAYESFKGYAEQYIKYKWLLLALAYGFILLPIHYSIERIKPLDTSSREMSWANKLKEIAKSSLNNKHTVLVNCNYPVEAMFYTNCIAYDLMPAEQQVKELELKGYKIVVMQPL